MPTRSLHRASNIAVQRGDEMDKFAAQVRTHGDVRDSAYLDEVCTLTARRADGELVTVAHTVSTIDYAYRVASIAVATGHTDLTLTAKEVSR